MNQNLLWSLIHSVKMFRVRFSKCDPTVHWKIFPGEGKWATMIKCVHVTAFTEFQAVGMGLLSFLKDNLAFFFFFRSTSLLYFWRTRIFVWKFHKYAFCKIKSATKNKNEPRTRCVLEDVRHVKFHLHWPGKPASINILLPLYILSAVESTWQV